MSEKDPVPGFEESGDRTVFQPMPFVRPRSPAPQPPLGSQNLGEALAGGFSDDQTVFLVNPGRRLPLRPAGTPEPAVPPPRRAAIQAANLCVPNDNPIMRAASPLLLLLGRLRSSLLRAPPSALTSQIAAAIETCEREMRASGVAVKEANTAKYVLCATADEVLAHLPAEDQIEGRRSGLMTRFFGESNDARRFFDELDRVKADGKAQANLLELFHACLALGFQGTQQSLPGGAATLGDVRHGVYELLQKAIPRPKALSLRWEGQPLASHAVRPRVPFWTAAGLVGLLLFGIFITMRVSLGNRAEAVSEAMTALNPATPVTIGRKLVVAPPPPPPPTEKQESQIAHIRAALGPQLTAGALSVEPSANQIVIHITDRVLFQPGKTTVLDDVRPLIREIAVALDDEKGVLKIVGHSDNTPIANARFASNFELSLERANVFAALLKQSLSHPGRIETQGKGADVPIASNDTVEGRGKNRRVEILVPRSD